MKWSNMEKEEKMKRKRQTRRRMKKAKKGKKLKKRRKVRRPKRKKRRLSIRELTIDILKRSKTAMHYRDITKRIKKRGYKFHRKAPERSVYITINRHPKIFRKTKPATYRLRK